MRTMFSLLLVTTVLAFPTVAADNANPYNLTFYNLLFDLNAIDWAVTYTRHSGMGSLYYRRDQTRRPQGNDYELVGWPYPRAIHMPTDIRPHHVIPAGCAWYSGLSHTDESCEPIPCPADRIEMFRGLTDQWTKTSKVREGCPRRYEEDQIGLIMAVRVPATFCCERDRFRDDNITIGEFILESKPKEMTGQCQWISADLPFCSGDGFRCPKRKYRHEVARAADAWMIHKNQESVEDRRAFSRACEFDGERVLCCKDSAFHIQKVVDSWLNTELNYLFPILIRRKT